MRAPQEFDRAFDRWRELYNSARTQLMEANAAPRSRASRARTVVKIKAAQMQASDQIAILEQGKATNGSDFYSYRYLATEGFLPGYNFPRLPLYAFIPGEGKAGSFLQRARFLAISEFGPRSLIYHEGPRLPGHEGEAAARSPHGRWVGTGHERTSSSAPTAAPVTKARSSAVTPATLRWRARCRCSGRSGSTTSKLPRPTGSRRMTKSAFGRASTSRPCSPGRNGMVGFRSPRPISVVAKLDPRPAICQQCRDQPHQQGLKRRKTRPSSAFNIDPRSGYWAKSEDEDPDVDVPPDVVRPVRIVPIVRDHKNALLFRFNDPDGLCP
jgi:hypothetical protein